ncbi:hypothetical protein FHS18_005589 [Paenibacillus phyllosphaerae]|uniref:Uncharacterized protein n=1 Tax=Paenibacillus phyllosphaerae TaxID=274593 RepID=A0A7W5B3C4_9BACL|nr:hypothetical protein [Paenibacillus phyllosphaerae]MBB3113477.1 hypothetical protein [Paenibacillus phyllosphaerae]
MKQKLKIANVSMTPIRNRKKRARVSSNSTCDRTDNAVAGVQEAGAELSRFFTRLQNEDNAAQLVRAIRCKIKRGVEDLLGPDCEVVRFFSQNRLACVRIRCVFGNCCDVQITFDICVSQGNCGNLVQGISDNRSHRHY